MTEGNVECTRVDNLMVHIEEEMARLAQIAGVEYGSLDYILAESDDKRVPTSIIVAVSYEGVRAEASLEVDVALRLSPQAVAGYLLGAGKARCQERARRR